MKIKKKSFLFQALPEDYYRIIIDSSLDMIITVDKERRIVEFNKSAQETFGYTLDEILGKTAEILYADPEQGNKIYNEVMEKGRCVEEVINKKKNGELFPSVLSASLLRNRKGELIGIMGISRDISERKGFEKKLENAAQEWRATFDALKDAIIMLDEKGVVKRCNLAFSNMLKKTFMEIVGKEFFEITDFPKEIFPYFRAMYTLKRESSIIMKEGKWFNVTSDPVLREGKFSGSVIIISDITEAKENERKLKESEEKYRLLFESAPDVIFTIERGIITSVNPFFEKVTGWRREDWINKHFKYIVHKEDLPVAIQNFRKILEKRATVKFELRTLSKKGEYLTGEYTLDPLIENEKVVGVIGIVRDITEYKKAISLLKESEERFRMLAENSPLAISLLRPDSTFEYLNPKFVELFGYTLEDIPDKGSWFNLAYPDESYREKVKSLWKEDFLDLPEPGKSKERELEITCKNGEKKIVRIRSVVMENGKKLQTYEDITERKKAEELLEERERHFRALIENATDLIAMFDANGKFLYISPSVERILGFTNEDVIGFSIFDFLHPSDLELGVKVFKKIAQNEGTSSPLRFRVRNKDGLWRYLEGIFNNLLRDPKINAILMNAMDITSTIIAEEKYRTLFEESKDGVYITDPSGRFLDINPAGVELLGFSSKEEILKVDIKDLYINPADREKYKEAMERYGYVKDYEIALRKKNGEKRIILDTGSVVRDEKGNIVAYRGIIRDITENKKLEQQLLQAQKMDAIGVLAGGIAHDFNNMLQVILGFTDLALSKISSTSPLFNDLQKIKNTTEKAANLVQKLLAFSRRQFLEKKAVDLNELLLEHVAMLKRIIPENIDLIVSTDAKKSTVFVDYAGMEQVIMNIALNARDAMPEGGTLTIETKNEIIRETLSDPKKALKPGEYLTLTFKDNGIGMNEEIISKIFEPFFTTKPKGRGTGLGLSVVWGIIKQHDGHIEVWSEPNKGSMFKIYFPIFEVVEKESKSFDNEKTIRGGNECILIAEDEEEIRELLRQILEKLGYRVILAKDGAEAIKLFEKNKDRVNLLILDVVMPKISGYDVYNKISSKFPEIQVIFITGYSEEALKEKITNLSKTVVIPKPFTPDIILNKVRNILDQS